MGNSVKAVTRSCPEILQSSAPLTPLLPSKDRYLRILPSKKKEMTKLEKPGPRFFPRENLESLFPGVLFRGSLIFVEEGSLIAPGVIIDTEDDVNHNRLSQIEIRGDSAIAIGTVLKGNITVVKSRLRSGSFVSGVVNLTEATLGRGSKIVGENIVCYQAVVLGSISGDTIRVNEATITSQGNLIGSNIVVYPDEVITRLEVGSDRRLGGLSNVGEKTLAVKP